MHIFEGGSANEVWQKAFAALSEGPYTRRQSGRGGDTKELLHAAFTIDDPLQRWIVARQPAINPAFAIADVIWMLNGRRDSAFVNYWNQKLPEYAGYSDHYHGAYGFRLQTHFGFDQLDRAYKALQHNPDGRQVALQIWDATVDFPAESGEAVNADIPCNVMALLKIRDGRLEWTQINRSNDIILGVPYNFIQFTTLQEVLSGWLGVELGSYTHFSDSLHLYDRDVPKARNDSSIAACPNTDSLKLPKEESKQVLADLSHRIEMMSKPDLSQNELRTLAETGELPRAFGNLLRVMVVEAARRRGWTDLVQDDSTALSNPALAQILERWQKSTARQNIDEN